MNVDVLQPNEDIPRCCEISLLLGIYQSEVIVSGWPVGDVNIFQF